MQSKKPQTKDKRIMPETRFTEFRALSVDPRVGISRYASETDVWLFFITYDIEDNCMNIIRHFFYLSNFTSHNHWLYGSVIGSGM